MVYVAYMFVWLCMTVAISVGIYTTGKWALLFFMIIPACMSINHKGCEAKSKKGKEVEDQNGVL